MTGYGRARAELPGDSPALEIEISTVNRKNFDLQLSAPREWTAFEQRLAEWMSGTFNRGRAQVSIKPAECTTAESGFQFNSAALDRSLEQMRRYAESRELTFQPDARLLLDLARLAGDTGGLPDWREIEASLKAAVLDATSQVSAMRETEGAALAKDLEERLGTLVELRKQIGEHASGASGDYRDALVERLQNLELDIDISDERVLREVALFADRSDISEELTRLQSHFDQFKDLLEQDRSVGRRLDFLCQEIHREFNTVASKATRIAITQAVIEAKNVLEQIREQVQNVE